MDGTSLETRPSIITTSRKPYPQLQYNDTPCSETRYMFSLWKKQSKTTWKTKSKTTWKMCGGGHSHSHSHSRGRQPRSHSHSHSRHGDCGNHGHASPCGHGHGHGHGDDHSVVRGCEPEHVQIAVPEPPKPKPYMCICTASPTATPSGYPVICCFKDAPPNCDWPALPPNCAWPTVLPPNWGLPSQPPLDFSYVCAPRQAASDEFRLEVIDTSAGRNRTRNGEKYTITIDSKAVIDDIFRMVDWENVKDVSVRWKNETIEELTEEIRVGELRRNAKCLVVTDVCCGH